MELQKAVSLETQSKIAIFEILKWRLSKNSPKQNIKEAKQNIKEAKQNKILPPHLMAPWQRGLLFVSYLPLSQSHRRPNHAWNGYDRC